MYDYTVVVRSSLPKMHILSLYAFNPTKSGIKSVIAEAAKFADADVCQMAKQITEIRSMLTQGDASNREKNIHNFTPRESSVLLMTQMSNAAIRSVPEYCSSFTASYQDFASVTVATEPPLS